MTILFATFFIGTFHDPFSWHRDSGCNSWDIFQVTAFARDLRPGRSIKWPKIGSPPIPTVRLSVFNEANKLVDVQNDEFGKAKYDVEVTAAILRLIKKDQPQLFKYLDENRQEDQVKKIINSNQLIVMGGHVYKDSKLKLKTTVVAPLSEDPILRSNFIVYDLRFDPDMFSNLSDKDLETKLLQQPEINPFYQLSTTKSQPVAPLSVLRDRADWNRLLLSKKEVESRYKKLIDNRLDKQIRKIFAGQKG